MRHWDVERRIHCLMCIQFHQYQHWLLLASPARLYQSTGAFIWIIWTPWSLILLIYIYSATCCWCALTDIAYCLCLEDILTSKSGSDETNKDNTNQETLGHDVPHIWAVGGLAQNKCEDGASSYDQFGIFDSWIQLASPLDSSNQIRLDNSPLPRWFFPAS